MVTSELTVFLLGIILICLKLTVLLADEPVFENVDTAASKISLGIGNFSIKYYASLVKNRSSNFVASSVSTVMILGMLSNGASGVVGNELHAALDLPKDSNVTNTAFQSLIELLNSSSVQSNFWLANHIFISPRIRGEDDFIIKNMEYFHAEANFLNFSNKSLASKNINDWCAEKTNNTIKNSTTPDTIKYADLILANAVYFNGIWENKFDRKKTLIASYWVNGSIKYIPTMQTRGKFYHGTIEKYKIKFIVLPYKSLGFESKSAIKMYVLKIPNEKKMKEFEASYSKMNFQNIQMNDSRMDFTLPKFRIETNLVLNHALSEMGMEEMFGYSVSLKGIIANQSAKIDKIIQKVIIEVNEEGTKIAAVTGGFAEPPPEATHTQIVLKPFIIAIVSEPYGTMLFSARVTDPTIDFEHNHSEDFSENN